MHETTKVLPDSSIVRVEGAFAPGMVWTPEGRSVRFAGRHLSFDEWVAERWGQVEALAKRQRVTLPTIDAQLAATALPHGLTFVTRNTADVRLTGVPLFNPWSG